MKLKREKKTLLEVYHFMANIHSGFKIPAKIKKHIKHVKTRKKCHTMQKRICKFTGIYRIILWKRPHFQAKPSNSINLYHESLIMKYWHYFKGKTIHQRQKSQFFYLFLLCTRFLE